MVMPLVDNFQIALQNSTSKLDVEIYTAAYVPQRQMMLTLQDPRLQLESPMLFWADCKLIGNEKIVAVGWCQTMKTMIVEFCYSTQTHGCVAELNLIPCPCADGGYGIWYGGTNTAALQFLGSGYNKHETDAIYFGYVNNSVLQEGGTEFEQTPDKKRVILSDSPFVNIPEDAICAVTNRNLPAAIMGRPFSMGHGTPVRTDDNTNLLAGSQLECVKARYRFTTYLCALVTDNPGETANITHAPAYAKIGWGIELSAYITATQIRKQWERIGPVVIRNIGAKMTEYFRMNGEIVQRRHGLPCNQGNRTVVFDYRLLNSVC